MQVASIADTHAAGLFLRRRGRDWSWLLLQARSHDEWGFPKGHLDPGESYRDAAIRECAEECGIALIALDAGEFALDYRLRDGRSKQVIYFGAETCQEHVILSKEHRAARWCSADTVVELLAHESLRRLFTTHLDHVRRL